MVRCDSDRGHHPGVSPQEPVSPMHGRIRPEQLRERSRTAFTHRASGTAPPIEHPSTGNLRRQAIQNAKPESGPKPAARPCLRFNSAKPCTRHVRQASSLASIPGASSQHRPTSAQLPAGISNELQAQDASASKQGGLAAKLLCTPSEVVSTPARCLSAQTQTPHSSSAQEPGL